MNTAVYENLYNNMKKHYIVVHENQDMSLGEAMLLKAGKKSGAANSRLPAVRNASGEKAITAFFKFVNDKLILKAPPVKDKTIKKFPLRTSAAAILSAVVACSLIISFGTATLRGVGVNTSATASSESDVEVVEDTYYTEK